MSKREAIRAIAAVAIVTAMVAAAEAFREQEIVFPEIMALATGALVAPRRSWNVGPLRMVALIAACSTAGVLIVRYIPLQPWLKAALAVAAAQTMLPLTRTTFAPMISAAVLPVILETESWVYPAASTILTAAIVFTRYAFERAKLCEPEPFRPEPLPSRAEVPAIAKRAVIGSSWTAASVALGCPFCAAPPLLVAFTELTRTSCPARTKPVRAVALISACALAGVCARGVFAEAFHLPIALAAACAASLAIAAMRKLNMFLPPAGAMAILPMLIPARQLTLFPFETALGAISLTAIALAAFRSPNQSTTPPQTKQHQTKTRC